MTPDQIRMGRASLNWSLERLAKAAGVHRNTVSNFEVSRFEVSRYDGDPETLTAIKHALESVGVIFENGKEAGVRLRWFVKGDLVRLRSQSRLGFNFDPIIKTDEIGEVVGVEPHPPQMGPTYRIDVRFSRNRVVRGAFKFEYELVRAATRAA